MVAPTPFVYGGLAIGVCLPLIFSRTPQEDAGIGSAVDGPPLPKAELANGDRDW